MSVDKRRIGANLLSTGRLSPLRITFGISFTHSYPALAITQVIAMSDDGAGGDVGAAIVYQHPGKREYIDRCFQGKGRLKLEYLTETSRR
jgi:hypothetical protein